MIETTVESVGAIPRSWSADAGYCSASKLEYTAGLEAAGETGFYISTRCLKHGTPGPESPRGRIPANMGVMDRMARKLKTKPGRKIYARRMAIVEPVFGQFHTRQGKHVKLRGPEKAGADWKLLAGCHNLMKLFGYRTSIPCGFSAEHENRPTASPIPVMHPSSANDY